MIHCLRITISTAFPQCTFTHTSFQTEYDSGFAFAMALLYCTGMERQWEFAARRNSNYVGHARHTKTQT